MQQPPTPQFKRHPQTYSPPQQQPPTPQFKRQPQTYSPPQQQWQQPPTPPPQQWNPQQQPFPPQLYPQPPQYQPQMPPPKKNSKKFVTLVLGIVATTVLFGCIGMLMLALMKSQTAQQTATNQSSVTQAVQQPTQAAQPTSKPTAKPTQQPTPKPTVQPTKAIAITHGTPHIGGPISDFYGKYGQSNNQGFGNSETWIVDKQQQTMVNATPNARGEVTGVTVKSGSNWSDSQTLTYCSQFLPSDASEFNSISNLNDYYSSVGEIVLQLEQASCVITISGQ